MDTSLSATISHINQLPAELLGECFKFLPFGERIRSSAVCKHWRTVAVGHAILWCDLDNVRMDALPVLLARTKDADVRLTARTVLGADTATLCELILKHMHHMRALDLQLHVGRNPQAVKDMLGAQAPRMQAFSLVIPRNSETWTTLNVPLFGDAAPFLRTLRMEGWTFTKASSATRNLVSFQAPGVVHTAHGIFFPSYTRDWARMFPALRELHVENLSQTADLWTARQDALLALRNIAPNALPSQLTTLVVEFAGEASVIKYLDAFRLLAAANFANMREVTLVNAQAVLVTLVLQALGDAFVSLELTGSGGPHIRLVTNTGTLVNFMCVRGHELDQVVCDNAWRLTGLRTLRLGEDVQQALDGRTIPRLCHDAPGIETLVLTGGVPDPENWEGSEALDLHALRELRILGPGIQADELAAFVRNRLSPRLAGAQPALTVAGVEIARFAPSIMQVDYILQTFFGEISFVPAPQAETTQRAEMFARSMDWYSGELWYARGG